jgi:hypothetical protein
VILSIPGGCGDGGAPSPATTAPPAATTSAAASATQAPTIVTPDVDAGADRLDGGVVTGTATGSLARCCAALRQDRPAAPPEQRSVFEAARAICAVARQKPASPQVFARIRAALAGVKVPAACQ